MQEVDKAVVLGSVSVKDNANVVKVISQKHGSISLYVSASGKKKSARNAVLQPLSLCEISFTCNKKSTLLNLKEAKLDVPLYGIQGDIFKNTIALFLADVLNKVVPEESDKEVFEFIKGAVLLFNEMQEGVANFHIAFLMRLTKWLGFYPHFQDDHFTNFDLKEGQFIKGRPNHPHYLNLDETKIIAQFLQLDWGEIPNIKLMGSERRKLLLGIIDYYTLHVPGFKEPKSLSILEEVFS